MPPFRPAHRAGKACAAHQQRNRVVTHHDPTAKPKLSMHPQRP
jgi:hypothetical protein